MLKLYKKEENKSKTKPKKKKKKRKGVEGWGGRKIVRRNNA